MKKLYPLLFLLFSLQVFSQHVTGLSAALDQNAIIYLKDGTQLPIKATSFGPNGTNRGLTYTLEGSTKEHSMGYGKIDSVIAGNKYKFKKFGGKNYFVLAEEGEKSLACYAKVTYSNGEMSTYILYVFDNKGKEIDRFEFTQIKREGRAKQRAEIPAFVKKYFSNCKPLIKRLDDIQSVPDELKLGFCNMCMDPLYFQCK